MLTSLGLYWENIALGLSCMDLTFFGDGLYQKDLG